MFQKLKVSLGIGAAKVDTILEQFSVFQGDTLKGTIHIEGGEIEQQIDAINLKLCTEVKVESDNGVSYRHFVLDHRQVVDPFVISPNENKDIPFELRLHDETPITALNARTNKCRVWLETALDIDMAIDPKDRDLIEVKPLPVIQRVLHCFEQQGFNMVKADVEKGYLNGDRFSSRSGCYQEIEFKDGGLISTKEVELSFILEGNTIHCLAEVDRTFGMRGDQYQAFSLDINASDYDIESAVEMVLSR